MLSFFVEKCQHICYKSSSRGFLKVYYYVLSTLVICRNI